MQQQHAPSLTEMQARKNAKPLAVPGSSPTRKAVDDGAFGLPAPTLHLISLSKVRIQAGNDSAGTHTSGAACKLWLSLTEGAVIIQQVRTGTSGPVTVTVRHYPLRGVDFYELADEPLLRAE